MKLINFVSMLGMGYSVEVICQDKTKYIDTSFAMRYGIDNYFFRYGCYQL